MPKADRRGATRARWRPPGWLWLALLGACLVGAIGWLATGCGGWDPSEPFDRNSPDVDRAIDLIDSGQFESAEEVLETYLGTGPCGDGGIGLPQAVRDKHSGAFDLGLTLFYLAEKFGQRFGDEELAEGGPEQDELDGQRGLEIECALIIASAIAHDAKVPLELRARAFYLAGNLEFLRRQYEDAVRHYDAALQIVPGLYSEAGGDSIGRDAAWNRAIALRRIQEEQDAGDDGGQDGEADAEPDAQPDAEPDAGDDDGGQDGGEEDAGDDGGGEDGGQDAGDGGDGGGNEDAGEDGGDLDAGGDAGQPPPEPDEADQDPEPQDTSQMDRLLDELEEAPTYQEQDAKRRAARARRRRVMEDK
jgi:tetratricopeptide (TPR) repeat protein